MVNQLRYEITLKDNLLKSFIEFENESDYSYEESSKYKSGKLYDVNNQTLADYKKKITFLEDENDMLRNKAEFYERETAELETKENEIIQNCFRELESSQSQLHNTQEELKSKTNECLNQQGEIQGLFSQVSGVFLGCSCRFSWKIEFLISLELKKCLRFQKNNNFFALKVS